MTGKICVYTVTFIVEVGIEAANEKAAIDAAYALINESGEATVRLHDVEKVAEYADKDVTNAE